LPSRGQDGVPVPRQQGRQTLALDVVVFDYEDRRHRGSPPGLGRTPFRWLRVYPAHALAFGGALPRSVADWCFGPEETPEK
jgi:hypothetical protein